MTIQLELWHFILLIISVIGAFWALAKMIIAQAQATIRERFTSIDRHLSKHDENMRLLERQVNELRIELPREYVRREDYVRDIASIKITIDNLALNIQQWMRDTMKARVEA